MVFIFRAIQGIVLLLVLAGCESTPPTQISRPSEAPVYSGGPGSFGVCLLKGLSRKSAATMVRPGPVVSFDLGSIRGSTSFYFILSNIGKRPITGISLKVDDPAFSVFPASIDTLLPGSDLSVLPVIKVVVYHGTPIEGPGFRPLMKKGLNDVTVTVEGTTTTLQEKDTAIALSANLRLFALIMDLEVSSGSGGPYRLPITSTARGELHFPDSNYYNFSSGLKIDYSDSVFILKNTGNVELSYKIYKSDDLKWNGYMVTLQDSVKGVIDTGCSIAIPFRYIPGIDNTLEHFFFIDGHNTVYDHRKLPVQGDGILYFSTIQYLQQNN
jgi:hypothetical protein